MYSEQQVQEATLGYFDGDTLATDVWVSKYCLKDKEGNFLELTPDDMFKRLAKELVRIEHKYPNPLSEKEIYEMLEGFKKFVLAGSPMYGIGNPYSITSISNCYCIGNEYDSVAGIKLINSHASEITKRRGGVGFDISHLRPKNANVRNSSNLSTGGVSFIKDIITSIGILAQHGRRGSAMVTCDSDYPDIEDFIRYKVDNPSLTGCNLSVRASDEFMHSAISGKNDKWDALVDQVWRSGDPGLLFWDSILKESPADCYPEYQSKTVNPCSELIMSYFGSCILASINLVHYVRKPFTADATLDLFNLKNDIQVFYRLMDDMVDLELEKIDQILLKIENDPEPEFLKATEHDLWTNIKSTLYHTRRVSIGFTGLGDVFAMLGIEYGNKDVAEAIAETIGTASYNSSIILAKERGAFPIFDINLEKNHVFTKRIFASLSKNDYAARKHYEKYGRRNIASLAIAPTGSISLLTKTTSGIEPAYSMYYTRKRKVSADHRNITYKDEFGHCWEEYRVFHPMFLKWVESYFNINAEDFINNTEIHGKAIICSPYYKQSAHDIDPKKKLKMIGLINKWIDHGISNTINMPESSSREDISEILQYAYKAGCKGVTVFRDNCISGVLSSESKIVFKKIDAPKRPKDVTSDIYTVVADKVKWSVVVGFLVGEVYEVFAFPYREELKGHVNGITRKVSSSKYDILLPNGSICENIVHDLDENYAAITRLTSGWLRTGGKTIHVAETLSKKGTITSFNKALARVLKKYIENDTNSKEMCPECKSALIYQEGCLRCSCGKFNKCE